MRNKNFKQKNFMNNFHSEKVRNPMKLKEQINNNEIDETSDESIEELTNITKYEFESQHVQWTLGFLLERINKQKIQIDPDFQRLPTAWKETRKQNLIISFYRGIPVPPIYLFEVDSGRYIVIDGLQRITAIKDFVDGKFSVEIDGSDKLFRDIDGFDDKIITVILIKQTSPNDAMDGQYEIFKILNQSAVVLNKQEIRNCVFRGKFNDFVKKTLNEEEEWRKVYGQDRAQARYLDVEMILRCLVIVFYMDDFSGSMTNTINGFIKHYNNNFEKKHADINRFKDTFVRACKFIIENEIVLDYKKSVRFESIFSAILKGIVNKNEVPTNKVKQALDQDIYPKSSTEFSRLTSAGGTGGRSSIEGRVGFVYEKLFKNT